jgi:hypothetical protein
MIYHESDRVKSLIINAILVNMTNHETLLTTPEISLVDTAKNIASLILHVSGVKLSNTFNSPPSYRRSSDSAPTFPAEWWEFEDWEPVSELRRQQGLVDTTGCTPFEAMPLNAQELALRLDEHRSDGLSIIDYINREA